MVIKLALQIERALLVVLAKVPGNDIVLLPLAPGVACKACPSCPLSQIKHVRQINWKCKQRNIHVVDVHDERADAAIFLVVFQEREMLDAGKVLDQRIVNVGDVPYLDLGTAPSAIGVGLGATRRA